MMRCLGAAVHAEQILFVEECVARGAFFNKIAHGRHYRQASEDSDYRKKVGSKWLDFAEKTSESLTGMNRDRLERVDIEA